MLNRIGSLENLGKRASVKKEETEESTVFVSQSPEWEDIFQIYPRVFKHNPDVKIFSCGKFGVSFLKKS